MPKAYGEWFRSAVGTDPAPDFVTDAAGYTSFWAVNRGRELPDGAAPDGQLTDFSQLPELLKVSAGEVLEMAFFCPQSMKGDDTVEGTIYHPYQRRHTDGTDKIREDLGGYAAYREGVKRIHAEGKRVVLYVEGLIVPEDSVLFTEHPEAKDWLVQNIGGDNYGPYCDQHWLHMCPGSSGWQNYLADCLVKLITETDVDGFRIDSLGGYHWECHNKTHNHENIHDYNQWVKQLSDVVEAKVHAVRPELYISTEEPIDYFHRHFNHSLHQITRPEMLRGALLGTAPLRVAFPDYKICYWGGIVGASMSLLADSASMGFGSREARLTAMWRSAFELIRPLYNRGDTSIPDFELPAAGVCCRHLRLGETELYIGLRPNLAASSGTSLVPSESVEPYTVELPYICEPEYLRICDLEKGELTEPDFTLVDGKARFTSNANWFFAIAAPKAPERLPLLARFPDRVRRGEAAKLSFSAPGCRGKKVRVGIDGEPACEYAIGAEYSFAVPDGIRLGFHYLTISGDGIIAGKRIFEVTDEN